MDPNDCFTADDEPAPLKPFGTGTANMKLMKLEIRDSAYRSDDFSEGWSVRCNADGAELGWSRIGYTGENAHLLLPPTTFYVDFDAAGTPVRFIDCGKLDGSYWAHKFGYGALAPSPEPTGKCNSPEPEPAPAAESLTDIIRSFCR